MSINDDSKVVIYDSRVMLQIVPSLTDKSRDVIYNCNMFILQACYIFLVTKNVECKQTQQKLDEARGYIGVLCTLE